MKRFALSAMMAFIGTMAIATTPSIAAGSKDSIVVRMTPAQIATFLKSGGYGAEIDTDSEGDPMIISGTSGTKFGVVFFDCEKNGALADRYCTDLEFIAVYTFDKKPSLATLNKWNTEQAFGKAYMKEDGDVILSMPINLAGGVSTSFLESTMEWWNSIVVEFEKKI